MRIAGMVSLWLAGALWAQAQAQDDSDSITLADVLQGAQEWAHQNLDTNAWGIWQSLNAQTAHQFLRDMQRRFQGEYIVSLAPYRDTAAALVPWLESRPETRPYASWLKARLDYFEVAEEFRVTIPPPALETNLPPPPPPVPVSPLVLLRELWLRKVAGEYLPPEATNYLLRLKPVFIAQRVPPELFWLAEVESDFDAEARSPSGAVGLFQLKPDTARRFGLSLSPEDERLYPEDNARASAQYLKYLHDRFQDWRLAIAGFNAGEKTVQKLLDRYHTRDYSKIARRLPAETQMYVPRVEAILERREGVKLSNLPAPPDPAIVLTPVDEEE